MNVELDVGPNITSMLERLAQQIGTTADKVFPWYVQQAYLEGVTTLATFAIAYVVAILVLLVAHRKADLSVMNGAAMACIAAGALIVFSALPALIAGPEAVRQIVNPNYYAMKMLTRDVGNLVRK